MKNQWLSKFLSAMMIVLLTLAALPVSPARAAVGVAGQWNGTAVIDTNTATSPRTGTYTVPAGSNRLLVVAVTLEYTSTQTHNVTATYGGQSLTPITQTTNQRQTIWVGYLNEAGIALASNTTLSVSFTTTNLTRLTVHAATYNGVNQTTPIAGSASSSTGNGNSLSFANIPVTNGGYIFYITNSNGDGSTPPGGGAGYTEHFDQEFGDFLGFNKSAASKAITTTGTETRTVNFTGGNNRQALSVVSLNPAPTNTTPTVSTPIADVNVLEDAANTVFSLYPNFADTESTDAQLTYTVTAISNTALFTVPSGGLPITIAGPTNFTLDYAPNANGTSNITVRATDPGGLFVEDTFAVNVTAVNDAPAFIKGTDQTVNEDAGLQTVAGWATGISAGPANETGQTLTFNASNNNNALFSVQPAVVANGTLTYTPAPNANGSATVTLTLSDNGGVANGGVDTSAAQTFTITVNPVDDAPVAVNDSANVNEDAAATSIDVLTNDTDSDGGTKQVASVGNASNGTVTNNTTNVSYQPNANYCGSDSFTYTLNGGSTATVSVTVDCVNDAPSFTKGVDQTVNEDAGSQTIAGWATGISAGPANEAGQSLTFNASNNNNALFSVQPAVAANGTLTYTPALNANGSATVTLTLSDNGGVTNGGVDTSAAQTFIITVNPVDDFPTASDDAATVAEDAPATAIDVLNNDNDPEGDAIAITNVTQPANGTVVNNGTDVTYQPDANYCGNDSFTYEINGGSSATVSVDVTCADDAPVAVDDNATFTEDDPATSIDVLTNDTDLDGGTKQVASVGGASNGTVTNNTADVSYQPNANYCGSDSFTYTLNGGSTATVNVTITCVDDAPLAVDDNFTVPGNTSSPLDVLGNDTDIDGGTKEVASVGSPPAHGAVTNNTTDFTYHPNTGYCGSDSFTYTLNGGSSATVTLDVVCAPVFTSADNTSFDFGFPGNFAVTATGNPSTMTISLTGAPAGISLVDNGDGTASLNGDGTTPVGVYNLILTADNGVMPNGLQNFTLTIRNGPTTTTINSTPDTGNGSISENESVSNTLGLTQLTVEFSSDVHDPADNTDPDDVTNPANYLLVRSATGTFATISCAGGLVAPDVSISVDAVTYSNSGGSGPFIATLNINSGLPLNVEGFYRLYVCGTTSIVDANNTGLALAGDGVNPGTDFVRNFRITAPTIGGGGGDDDDDNDNRANAIASSIAQGGVLIPVTGFAPNQVTHLPSQTSAYAASGLSIEIPSLSLKMPIVGVDFNGSTWDVTWLGRNAAYLEGSAYPTWKGNTILTGHATDPNGKDGPFAFINELQPGQKIYIRNNGFTYVYEVRQSSVILPTNIKTLFQHEDDSWLSLVTCENFNDKTGKFANRRLVRAVLISILPTK